MFRRISRFAVRQINRDYPKKKKKKYNRTWLGVSTVRNWFLINQVLTDGKWVKMESPIWLEPAEALDSVSIWSVNSTSKPVMLRRFCSTKKQLSSREKLSYILRSGGKKHEFWIFRHGCIHLKNIEAINRALIFNVAQGYFVECPNMNLCVFCLHTINPKVKFGVFCDLADLSVKIASSSACL